LPQSFSDSEFELWARPSQEELLFDYAGLLEDAEESVNKYLRVIRDRYKIEAVILTVKDVPSKEQTEDFVTSVVSSWGIGKKYSGRGILLVLVDSRKDVKLEIGYELEDVFTDLFAGHVEDRQLKPYFLADDIGTGLVALMEELERRAQVKHQGDYSSERIAEMDRSFLSGGGGASRNLKRYATNANPSKIHLGHGKRGGDTPLEAFKIMVDKWSGQKPHTNRDIYTASTKMAYHEYGMGSQNKPDARTRQDGKKLSKKIARVKQDGRYAIVHFDKIKGWDNSPYMFFRTDSGWKFDIVSQRKYVTMGQAPMFSIQWANHGYAGLIGRFYTSMGKDLHLPKELQYDPSEDEALAASIRRLESKEGEDEVETLIELARLNVLTSRRPNKVFPILKKVKRLAPANALVHLYAAVYHIESRFQYKSAIKELKDYIAKAGESPIALDLLGFSLLQAKDYSGAIDAFEDSLELQPQNPYALCKLSRAYGLMALEYNKRDRRFIRYRSQAVSYLQKAGEVNNPDTNRTARLAKWLNRKLDSQLKHSFAQP
jgi:tetratricopeptide (TPR) repeat protein